MKVLAIDFDGVIHDFKNPVPHRRMGPPIFGTKEALETLKNQGYELIIFCVWGDEKGQKTIADFMKYYGLPFDSITNIKPQADYYIDDKAIRFKTWNLALEEVNI
jgi:hypothetical protein